MASIAFFRGKIILVIHKRHTRHGNWEGPMSPKAKASTTKKRGTTRNKSTPAKTPIKVFISYSHKDTKLKEEFMDMLTGLEKQNVIQVWQDREIEPGDNWYRAIRSAMLSIRG